MQMNIVHDVRVAMRSLARRPAFTTTLLLTLSLGIGANTAVFSVVHGILLAPLSFREPDRLAALWPGHFISNAELLYLQEHARTFEAAAFSPGWGIALSGDGEPMQLKGARTSTNLFSTLGTHPVLGREFAAEESTPGRADVAILSAALWRTRFGADPQVIGRGITLDGNRVTVIGVMPSGFEFSETGVDIWLPLEIDPSSSFHTGQVSEAYARLRPTTTFEQAAADFERMVPGMRSTFSFPDDYGRQVSVIPLREALVGNVRSSLLVLFGAVGFIVLIATANVGNLLLARTAERHREIAVRRALGARRRRLVRDIAMESACVAVGGGALGMAIGVVGVVALKALLPADTPRLGDVTISATVLAVTGLVTALAAVLFSAAPTALALRMQPQSALRARGNDAGGRAGERARGVLVATEVAMALVLVVGAGLMLRTLWNLSRVDLGFQTSGVLTFRLQPTQGAGETALRNYLTDVQNRLRALPGVRAVGAIHHVPLGGSGWYAGIEVEGRPLATGATPERAAWRVIDGDYVQAMRIPLRDGRLFSAQDDSIAPQVAMVNTTFAQRFWPGENPLGKRFKAGNATQDELVTVVGVIGDVHHRGAAVDPEPELYRPMSQLVRGSMVMVVRSDRSETTLVPAVRRVVQQVNANVPISEVRTLKDMVSSSVAGPRLVMSLLLAFALVGVTLGVIGVYGVVSYAVSQRTHEIGVRIALGAAWGSVVAMVIRRGIRYTSVGILAGVGISLAVNRALAGLVFGVSVFDAPLYLLLSTGLLAVVIAASWLPARRAASVDPMRVLRGE